jgi:CheY-like chemotaxis protein
VASASALPILVASDNVDDARLIVRQLQGEFDKVSASTDPEQAVSDFESHQPAVLVLAFDSLNKAQHYYLGLFRLGRAVQQRPHRTVILCHKDEVRAVCALCKKDLFDDYVLFWPHSYDGSRLSMSIWIACREMAALNPDAPRTAEMLTHAKLLGDLETTLAQEFGDGERQLDAARNTLGEVDRQIAGAIDEFSQRLTRRALSEGVEGQAIDALAIQIEQFKAQQIEYARRVGAGGIEMMNAWTRRLKERIEPLLADTRALGDRVRLIRPRVMVVEDDDFARQLVARMLDPRIYELSFAGDGAQALNQLRRERPDVILMDITLPGLDGLSLTQLLKSSVELADIPVIMMTGDSRRATLLKSMEAGAAAFVVKPFSRESLSVKLEAILPR